MQFFCYTQGDDNVPQLPPTPELLEEMGKFFAEAQAANVIVATGGLEPAALGTQVSYDHGEFSVVDGPFAEGKELIGGWALLDVPSREEAVSWTKKFLAVNGGGRSTVRRVYGPDDVPPWLEDGAGAAS